MDEAHASVFSHSDRTQLLPSDKKWWLIFFLTKQYFTCHVNCGSRNLVNQDYSFICTLKLRYTEYLHTCQYSYGSFLAPEDVSFSPQMTSKMKPLQNFSLSADCVRSHPYGETLWDSVTFVWALTICEHVPMHCRKPHKCLSHQSRVYNLSW